MVHSVLTGVISLDHHGKMKLPLHNGGRYRLNVHVPHPDHQIHMLKFITKVMVFGGGTFGR